MDRRRFATLLMFSSLAGCAVMGAPERSSQGLAVRVDYQAAEALLAVLGQSEVTDAEIDRLLALKGVAALVDNTTKYIPSNTRETFRAAVKEFVSTRKSTIGRFRLDEAFARAGEVRALIAELKADQSLKSEITGLVDRYTPDIGPLATTVYAVVGGVSDGFVPDGSAEPAFYMDIHRARGDARGVKLNMAHELFHVVHRAARAQVPGLDARVFDAATAPSAVRLMTLVLEEGAATHVAAPLLAVGDGPYMTMWRAAYSKNAPPEKIRSNFAEFDRVLAGLDSGAMTWDEASRLMFTGTGAPLYFVGYEMVGALDRRHGPEAVAGYLQQHPAAFFKAYIDLYRRCPSCAPATFSSGSETIIQAMAT